ncbi:LPS assembly lipoprotein LptE [Cognatishimia sp. F0-27]|uniref:LPS assembly lipoprotein LptE n=1 Tax=Cognatishimia sp. F0-27 TaxID=2816855 RepID=UPI001D0C2104
MKALPSGQTASARRAESDPQGAPLGLTRRALLVALGGSGLTACGFQPVYGPGGGGRALEGQIALSAAETPESYAFNRRFEERLGRSTAAPWQLGVQIQTDQQDLGSTSTGSITRYRIIGRAQYALMPAGSKTAVIEGRTNAFTGYSTTGSTVATLAAERDARERLMVILADQVIDSLILRAPDLGAPS